MLDAVAAVVRGARGGDEPVDLGDAQRLGQGALLARARVAVRRVVADVALGEQELVELAHGGEPRARATRR